MQCFVSYHFRPQHRIMCTANYTHVPACHDVTLAVFPYNCPIHPSQDLPKKEGSVWVVTSVFRNACFFFFLMHILKCVRQHKIEDGLKYFLPNKSAVNSNSVELMKSYIN